MPRTKSRRKTSPQRVRNVVPVPQLAIVPAPEKPVRGVKLKTVSRFAMVFALLCLGAFIAGRVDVAAPIQPAMVVKSSAAVVAKGARDVKRPTSGEVKGTPLRHSEQRRAPEL
jgi:hypothetical protein